MRQITEAKLNNAIPLPFESEYIKIPADLKHLPGGAQLVGGLIFSFSGKQDADGVYSTVCRSRAKMKESLSLSFPSLSRNIKALIDDGYISRLSRDEYIFNRDRICPDDFTRLEFGSIKDIMTGCDRIQGVRLRVFGLIYTRCNNDKKIKDNPEAEELRKQHKVTLSYADIAALVGCSEQQAKRAVKWLLKNGYVHRPEIDKGTSIKYKSIYTLARAYWRRIKRKRAAEQATPEPAEPEQTEQQKAAEREALLRERAAQEAERNERRARRSERYMAAYTKVAGLTVQVAFTSLKDQEKAEKLEAELAHWEQEKAAALEALGLSRELLDEEYLYKLYAAGGAPPGNGVNVGVGESNKKN